MSGDGLEHDGLERLFANQSFVTKYGIRVVVDPAITRAAKNVAWVHDTLQLLVDYPRLLENPVYLLGTLRSLIESLDADNNPVMAVLRAEGERRA